MNVYIIYPIAEVKGMLHGTNIGGRCVSLCVESTGRGEYVLLFLDTIVYPTTSLKIFARAKFSFDDTKRFHDILASD